MKQYITRIVVAVAVLLVSVQPVMGVNWGKVSQSAGRVIKGSARGAVSSSDDASRYTRPERSYRFNPKPVQRPVFIMCQACAGQGQVFGYDAYGQPYPIICPACNGAGGYWQRSGY